MFYVVIILLTIQLYIKPESRNIFCFLFFHFNIYSDRFLIQLKFLFSQNNKLILLFILENNIMKMLL